MSFVISSRVYPTASFAAIFAIGKSRRLGRQCRTARHAWIHFNDDHFAVIGIDTELDVRSARLDSDLADDAQGGIAHALIFLVRQASWPARP